MRVIYFNEEETKVLSTVTEEKEVEEEEEEEEGRGRMGVQNE